MIRRSLPIVLALVASALAGCDRVAATGSTLSAINPLRGFESRCEELPATRVEVIPAADRVEERYDVPYAALTSRHQERSPAHRTVGLTEVRIRHASTIDFAGIEDTRGRTCMRANVRVELSAAPITVYVASEYRGDTCREQAIRAHEYRHVDVYRDYVNEVAPALATTLRARLGSAPRYGANRDAVQRELDRAVRDELSGFLEASERELAKRNARVDDAEEYAGFAHACG